MDECIFCKIIEGKIPSKTLYENEKVIVILDINPANEGHALVITKKHYKNILDVPGEDFIDIMETCKKIANAQMKGLEAGGFNIGINTGEIAGQEVEHFHIHIIPRFEEDGLETWARQGKYNEGKHDEVFGKIKQSLD